MGLIQWKFNGKGIEIKTFKFTKFEMGLLNAVNNTIEKMAFNAEAVAKQNCPVDTGRLRSSIASNYSHSGKTVTKRWEASKSGKTTLKQPKARLGEAIGQVGTSVDYAFYVEFGTSLMHARPFLLYGVHDSNTKMQAWLKAEIAKIKVK
ncbi:HK97 gp10 family phage protein [Patescibacteria group bacterium]|nr:HK97 gp10 family phage protein [Patescibacteria group bacterium]